MDLHPSTWPTPPKDLVLADDEVHVWCAVLDQPASVISDLLEQLSTDELERARRFYFDRDRYHYVVARGLLRTILGIYLRLDPARIRFRYNAFGKPSLEEGLSEQGLCFNVSHSHALALYAFTRQREVGLDIEYMRRDFATEEIAERFFSRWEVEVFRKLPPHLRVQGFFNCWTRKESFIKAKGKGLSLALDSFAVSLVPGERPLLLRSVDEPEEVSRWSLMELTPGPDYAAALMVEGSDWKLKCWQWENGSFPGKLR